MRHLSATTTATTGATAASTTAAVRDAERRRHRAGVDGGGDDDVARGVARRRARGAVFPRLRDFVTRLDERAAVDDARAREGDRASRRGGDIR